MTSSYLENLRFRASTCKQKAGVFKHLHFKRSTFGDRFHQIIVDGIPTGEKHLRFQPKTDTYGRGLRICRVKLLYSLVGFTINSSEVLSPEILSYVARNFIVLNNILAFLLLFAVLVSSDRRLYNEIY